MSLLRLIVVPPKPPSVLSQNNTEMTMTEFGLVVLFCIAVIFATIIFCKYVLK